MAKLFKGRKAKGKTCMIKLIASDIDGTLLQQGETEIAPVIFNEIRRLGQKGIRFCAASGRQYASLRSLFAPVANDIYFLCENGAVLYQNETLLAKTVMPHERAVALIHDILAQPECEALVSGVRVSFLMPKQKDYYDHIRYFLGNEVQQVATPDDIREDIVKVSAYCPGNAAAYDKPLGDGWRSDFQVAVAGEKWLDFTLGDKGSGIQNLCGHLGISPADTLAIGDNYNDLPMLQCVGHPYIIKGSTVTPDAAFCSVTDRVEHVLQTL